MVVDGQLHAPAALSPVKSIGTHCTGRWVGPSTGLDVCGGEKNLLPLPGFEPLTFQFVPSCCTDCAIAAP
jgi:hypothetical protein